MIYIHVKANYSNFVLQGGSLSYLINNLVVTLSTLNAALRFDYRLIRDCSLSTKLCPRATLS
jgi:hypothetical protein